MAKSTGSSNGGKQSSIKPTSRAKIRAKKGKPFKQAKKGEKAPF